MTRRAETPFHDGDHEKGDAPLIGLVLLFGMVFAGAALVALSGMALMDSLEGQSTGERSLQQAEQLRADLTSAQFSGDRVSLATERGDTRVEQDGTIEYQLNPNDPNAAACSVSRDLGTIMYEDEGHELALQAGGVFQETESSSRMILRPSLEHQQMATENGPVWIIRFPPVNVSESAVQSATPAAYYDHELSAQERDALQDGLCLPPHEHDEVDRVEEVQITITDNTYQDAWYRFLEDEVGDVGTVERSGNQVIATVPLGPVDGHDPEVRPEDFTRPPQVSNLEQYGAIVSTASDLEFTQAYVDSYDSRVGPYSETESGDGNIVAYNDLTLGTGTNFDANAYAGNDIILDGANSTNGDAYRGGTIDGDPDRFDSVYDWSFLAPEPESIDDGIRDLIEIGAEHNDNNETDAIGENDLLSIDNTDRLESGVYYFDSLTIGAGEVLELNAVDDDIVILVDGDINIAGEVHIIDNDSSTEVRWFADGNFDVQQSGKMTVVEEQSTQNFIFPTGSAKIDGENFGEGETGVEERDFVGVLYMPDSSIIMENHAVAYGGLVGQITVESPGKGGGQHNYFHYDQALDDFTSNRDDWEEEEFEEGERQERSIEWEYGPDHDDYGYTIEIDGGVITVEEN